MSGPEIDTLVDIITHSYGHSLHPLHRSLGVEPDVDLLGGVVWTTCAHHQVTVHRLRSAAQVSKAQYLSISVIRPNIKLVTRLTPEGVFYLKNSLREPKN